MMHMRNAEPFNAQSLFVFNKIMRQANRIQSARNCKQQALETIMANIFCEGTFQKKPLFQIKLFYTFFELVVIVTVADKLINVCSEDFAVIFSKKN